MTHPKTLTALDVLPGMLIETRNDGIKGLVESVRVDDNNYVFIALTGGTHVYLGCSETVSIIEGVS
jgi:hypothetical protein